MAREITTSTSTSTSLRIRMVLVLEARASMARETCHDLPRCGSAHEMTMAIAGNATTRAEYEATVYSYEVRYGVWPWGNKTKGVLNKSKYDIWMVRRHGTRLISGPGLGFSPPPAYPQATAYHRSARVWMSPQLRKGP